MHETLVASSPKLSGSVGAWLISAYSRKSRTGIAFAGDLIAPLRMISDDTADHQIGECANESIGANGDRIVMENENSSPDGARADFEL